MTYRLARTDDVPQIEELCKKEGLEFPNLKLCFVAEHEKKIVGFINMAIEAVIDTLISENPISAVRLTDMMIGACSIHNRVICYTKRDSVAREAEKYGFKNIGTTTVLIKEM